MKILKALLVVGFLASILVPATAGASGAFEGWVRSAERRVEWAAKFYGGIFRRNAQEKELDPRVLLAVAVVESAADVDKPPSDGGTSHGIMRVSEVAAKHIRRVYGNVLHPQWRTHKYYNVNAAAFYVRLLLDYYGYEDREALLIAYNYGPGRQRIMQAAGIDFNIYHYVQRVNYLVAYIDEKNLL